MTNSFKPPPLNGHQRITPPSSFVDAPLTPPPTDEKAFNQAPRVIALFKEIEAGRHNKQHPWTEFQLAPGEYDEIEGRLRQNEWLFGYVEDKIRYDYDGRSHRLVVRMPTGVHERFIGGVEDAIRSQLKTIGSGSHAAALFAQKLYADRSTRVTLPVDDNQHGTSSKHEPDASFSHDDAKYPGVIIEVAYSQKRKRLARLAEDYLLDSDANVRVVVGLDIEYGKKESRKATLSVWRPHVVHTSDGDELRAVQEIADEAFRDDQGNPTGHPGLRFQLSDFACGGLAKDVIGGGDREIFLTTQQLCQCLSTAEDKFRGQRALFMESIPPGMKKRKRSETPAERMTSEDEGKYAGQEERASKRVDEGDPDYDHTSIRSSSSLGLE